jgi:hypothetical protein
MFGQVLRRRELRIGEKHLEIEIDKNYTSQHDFAVK